MKNKTDHINRRAFLGGAMAGLGALAIQAQSGQAAEGQDAPAPKKRFTIGASTLGFLDSTNDSLAHELAGSGFDTVQLFLRQVDSNCWSYNGRADVSEITPDRAKSIARSYAFAGLTIHSIGVYTNLIHPDESEVKANLAYFEAMMDIGSAMGVHKFITEAGHYTSDKPEAGGPYHFNDEVWVRMVSTFKELGAMAAKRNSVVLIEPYFEGFLASAKRTRVFLQEVDSPSIRALLDPANLLEVNDLEEMFAQLSPWIDCFHAKDRKMHTRAGVAAGKGDLDYVKFVRLAAEHAPHAPLILEYVGMTDYMDSLKWLRKAIQEM